MWRAQLYNITTVRQKADITQQKLGRASASITPARTFWAVAPHKVASTNVTSPCDLLPPYRSDPTARLRGRIRDDAHTRGGARLLSEEGDVFTVREKSH